MGRRRVGLVCGISVFPLLLAMFSVVLNVQLVKGNGTIYIRADGSIDPLDAPISTLDNITYTFTDTINDSIVIERDNIIVDGAGYTLQGTGAIFSRGISLSGGGNVTIKNMEIKAFWYGILFDSSNNRILGNNLTDNEYCVWIESSSNNIFRNNSATNNRYGFFVYGVPLSQYIHDIDASNTIEGKPVYYWINKQNMAIPVDAGYVGLVNCTNIVVENLRLEKNGQGILLAYTTNSTIIRNTVINNRCGIELHVSSNNNLFGNNVTGNNEEGIILYSSSNNSIKNNMVANNAVAMLLSDSLNNGIVENNITDNKIGILLMYSLNNNILGNNITNNNLNGIQLEFSSDHNIISTNTITSNGESGISLSSWPNSETSNNRISGNMIAYNNEGGITLSGSSNYNIISENYILDSACGISLYYSFSNSIVGNTITNNSIDGLCLSGSSNYNSIIGNNIANSSFDGILLENACSNNNVSRNNIANNGNGIHVRFESSNNTISCNIIANSVYGVWFTRSNCNIIVGNDITGNDYGIVLRDSFNNSVHHNNFVNNINQVESTNSVNIWDNGYPSGGNYWSDYADIDQCSGSYQNETGSDGIWDHPFIIDEGNKDNYPIVPEFPSMLVLPLFIIAALLTAIAYKRKQHMNI